MLNAQEQRDLNKVSNYFLYLIVLLQSALKKVHKINCRACLVAGVEYLNVKDS